MTDSVPERLGSIRNRITSACTRAGRNPDEVTLIGAAKRQPEERIRAASEAGLRNFGENLVQEAEAHRRLLGDREVDWHLIGPLQSNKARRAARLFSWFHSIDRLKIARRLDQEARALDRRLLGMIEVNLGAEPSKHGFPPEELPEVADELMGLRGLSVVGLMAIPPVSEHDEQTRKWFRRLRALRDQIFASDRERPGLLSMGMSADFEIAIEEGATHVRIGSDLFGPREPRP